MKHLGTKPLETPRLTLRQADRNNQGICDMVVYSLLASERKR